MTGCISIAYSRAMDSDEYRDDSATIYAVGAYIVMALAILSAVGFVLAGVALALGMVLP